MKVLVTGGCGFIGSHVVDKLLEKGYEVTVLHRPTCKSKNLRHVKGRIEEVFCDVQDFNNVKKVVKNVDSVIHLAALINVDQSIQHPMPFWDVNVKGTLNILESIRKENKKLIFMSTCEIYGNVPEGKATEDHPTNPRSPYAVSKFCAERYCMAYYYTYNLPITIIRGFNIFGTRQSADAKGALIPKFVKKVLGYKQPLIFGDGLQSRDYVYVTDIAEGLVEAIEKDNLNGEIINLATGVDHSIKDIAYKIIEFCERDFEPKFIDARAGELRRSVGDYTKAKKLLNWKPKINFDEGLRSYVTECKFEKEEWKM